MAGGAGRMDVLCRCVSTSFFLSHEFRRDVECFLVLLGEPDTPKIIRFSGAHLRYLSPDERSAGSLIKKALSIPVGTEFRESTPGVTVRRGGVSDIVKEYPFAVLDEGGTDIRTVDTLPDSYILSDHLDFTPPEMDLLAGKERFSVGPCALHANHAITVLHNEIDRRSAGW
jgi:tRNA (pseudouridine54-N1)-methyltransferase